YEHAIELDPNFAMAYARAASVYATVGEMDKSIQARKKAFELREHTTQREKLVIAATYYHYVTGEIDRALTEYEVWEQMYPRDLEPHVNRAALYLDAGLFERAFAEGKEAIQLNPNHSYGYYNAGWGALRSGQTEEAKHLFEEAVTRKIDGPMIHRGL